MLNIMSTIWMEAFKRHTYELTNKSNKETQEYSPQYEASVPLMISSHHRYAQKHEYHTITRGTVDKDKCMHVLHYIN